MLVKIISYLDIVNQGNLLIFFFGIGDYYLHLLMKYLGERVR